MVTTKESIHQTIKQSQLCIFKVKAEKKVNKEKMKLAAANTDSNLFCKLFIACGARKGDVTEFFKHENNRYPPSLSEFGSLRKPNDDLVMCLLKPKKIDQPYRSQSDSPETASALIMNALSHIQMVFPATPMTVKDYSEQIFDKLIDKKREKYDRVDVLFDVNEVNSFEEMTKEICDDGIKYVNWIDNETKLHNGAVWFAKFLSKAKVKTQFLKILASNYVKNTPSYNGNVYGFEDNFIVSSCNEIFDTNYRLPIENVNARMVLHVEEAVRKGHHRILMSTSDVDIVSVAIYAFKYLTPDLEKLWIELVDIKDSRIISIHELYDLHNDKADVLPLFNAFTGCRTTSAFFGVGKTTAWNAWIKYPSVTNAMLDLLNGTPNLSNKAMDVLEEFTVKMYDSKSKTTKLHECRRDLFTRKTKPRTIDRIPPTRDALEQHLKRSVLQSLIWTQCIRQNIGELDPTDWGWLKQQNSNRYEPIWISIPTVADRKELILCKCPKQCSGRCTCRKNQLPCTMLCACDGNCEVKAS